MYFNFLKFIKSFNTTDILKMKILFSIIINFFYCGGSIQRLIETENKENIYIRTHAYTNIFA